MLSKLDMFREAVGAREILEATMLAQHLFHAMGRETPPEVFSFLDKYASRSQVVAMVCAMSFHFRDEPTPGHRIRMLKKVSRGGDDTIAADAMFAVAGECLLDEKTVRKAMDWLRRAGDMGHGEALVRLAYGLEHGIYRNRVDNGEAYATLAEAVDLEYGPAKLAMADFIIRHGVDDDDYHPLELLREAIEDEVEGAEELLEKLVHIATEDQEEADGPDHPEMDGVVVPDGMERPNLLRNAICNELPILEDQAAHLVSILHGFSSWNEMVQFAENPMFEKGPFDEDCGKGPMDERRMTQIAILGHILGAPAEIAEEIWALLRPTAKEGHPSLRGLDRAIVDKLRKE